MQYLPPCLEALLHDQSQEYDIIIVDNGSIDGSAEYINSLQKEQTKQKEGRHQIFLIINNENMGFCKAVNQGIEAAKTPYVVLLNNDTKIIQGFVMHLEQALESGKDVFSVSAKMLMMNQPDRIDGAGDYYCALGWAFARGKGKIASEPRYQKRREVFSACGGAAIYRAEVLKKIGLFDENHFAYLEDLDLGFRAKIYGYRNLYEPKAQVYHVGSGFSGSQYNDFKTGLASANSVYVILKNMPFLQIVLNLVFLLPGFAAKCAFFSKKGMGKAYVLGLKRGFQLGISSKGREKRVKFSPENLPHYCRIQLQLWQNLFFRIVE